MADKNELDAFKDAAAERLAILNMLEDTAQVNLELEAINEDLMQQIAIREQAERALSESEEKYRSYIENAPDGVFISDEKGNYVEVNPAACKITGYSEDELLKLSIPDLLLAEDIELGLQHFTEVKEKGFACADFRFITKNGEIRFWNVAAVKLSEMCYLGFVKDITDRKHAEEKILQINIDLERQYEEYMQLNEVLLETNRELEISLVKAQESERLKAAFLTNMSHEIRTPMNGIFGFTELLKQPGFSGKEQKEFINLIEKSGQRLLNTLKDIMDMSIVESGAVKINETVVNVNEQIEDIFNFYKSEAAASGLEFSYSLPESSEYTLIYTDREKLYAIISNFVKNAIKFTNAGKVDFGYSINDNKVKFFVKDTGIGIPKEKQTAIFERFIQVEDSYTRNYEGSGLGLSISRAYAELLGGSIELTSEPGDGSLFELTIPYKAVIIEAEGGAKGDIDKANDLQLVKKKLVLVVDDDKYTRILIGKLFKNMQVELIYAKTGTEAIEECRKNPDIALILMDIKMPGMNGYDATAAIREFNKDIIIIAQTAFAESNDRQKAIDAGCNDYVTKPYNTAVFMSMVNDYLK